MAGDVQSAAQMSKYGSDWRVSQELVIASAHTSQHALGIYATTTTVVKHVHACLCFRAHAVVFRARELFCLFFVRACEFVISTHTDRTNECTRKHATAPSAPFAPTDRSPAHPSCPSSKTARWLARCCIPLRTCRPPPPSTLVALRWRWTTRAWA